MKLYELNTEIDKLVEQLDFDWETGEIGENYDDALYQRIMQMSAEKHDILEYLAKKALNTKSDAEALDAEIKRLTERKRKAENRYKSLVNVLDRECAGEKTDLGVATVSYRTTTKVDFTEEGLCLAWLKDNGYTDAYKVEETISKTELKKIFKKVDEIPGAVQITSKSCSLR